MNSLEQAIVRSCSVLQRIPTTQRPRVLSMMLPKNHNPDFILYNTILIEAKGHVRDPMFRPMLKAMPDWLRSRYRVVVADRNAKSRHSLCRFLDSINVKYCIGADIPPEWVLQAVQLRNEEGDLNECIKF